MVGGMGVVVAGERVGGGGGEVVVVGMVVERGSDLMVLGRQSAREAWKGWALLDGLCWGVGVV